MYTSAYSSSSPVRTYTSRTSSSAQQPQSSFSDSTYPQAMDDYTISSRRMPTSYSNSQSTSIPVRTTTSRRYPENTHSVSNDPISSNRYPSTSYSSSYRNLPNDTFVHRTNTSRYGGGGGGATERAHSYDDLLHDQHRSQPSTYNSNGRLASHHHNHYAPSQGRREPSNDRDDDLIVKSTDLSATHEQEMLDLVRMAFRKYELSNQRELAGFLKRAADKTFAACWHCIVGRQFSSYVTHEMNGFIYLTKGPLSILLFKSGS